MPVERRTGHCRRRQSAQQTRHAARV